MSPVPPPVDPTTRAAMVAANLVLSSRAVPTMPLNCYVLPWNPDAPLLAGTNGSFQFIAGPDRCGMPDRDKFFRGFRVYGVGTGSYLAFVDGQFVQAGSFDSAGAALGNLVSFPRGTSGRELVIAGSLAGPFDHLDVLFDPMGILEDS